MLDLTELSSLLDGDIDDSPNTLEIFSRDASIFSVRPEVVVYPKNVQGIKKLVVYANNNQGMTLTARAGGTDMTGGPLSSSVIVDFTRYFDHIKEVNTKRAVVEPGVYYRDFDKATLVHGAILPSFPASRDICTVGGMVANNSGGEKTLTYGKTERYVRRLKAVLADGNEYEFRSLTPAGLETKKSLDTFEGEIYRKMSEIVTGNQTVLQRARPAVSKNSCGYYLWNIYDHQNKTFDLTKLLVGSQGTLGLITEIEFDLIKPKSHSRLLVIFLKDLKSLAKIANHVLRYGPESFESYDDHTFRVAVKFLPALIRQLKGNIVSLCLKFLPELWAIVRGGVPKMVLLAEFTADSDEKAMDKAKQAQESLGEFNIHSKISSSAADAQKYWIIRRQSFNLLRKHAGVLSTAPFIDDFIVRPDVLPEFLPKLYSILDQYKLTYTIAGHVGDGNFHIIPLMNLHEEKAHKIIEELSVKVYELVHQFGGSITGEHNDGIIRTPFVKMQYGQEVYALFEETKKIWDPKGIFNPGKKVGGTMKYALEHIMK